MSFCCLNLITQYKVITTIHAVDLYEALIIHRVARVLVGIRKLRPKKSVGVGTNKESVWQGHAMRIRVQTKSGNEHFSLFID
jgi:hypothetical protein